MLPRLSRSLRSSSAPWVLLGTTAAVFLTSLAAVSAKSFDEEVRFLKSFTPVIVLSDTSGQAKVALAPAWQGRVMTSTATGDTGLSFGWINHEAIASRKLQEHINVFGGEDRFWLGPEGGQFSIFFAPGAAFDLQHWYTPAPIDTLPYAVRKQSSSSATFESSFSLTNYSGTRFDLSVRREVHLVNGRRALSKWGISNVRGLSLLGYESINRIQNAGTKAWDKTSGLLSVWILGMFNPSPATTIIVPIKSGPDSELGKKVTSDYFGSVPDSRLVVRDHALFFNGDGQFRSKIGVSPKRSRGVLGSYDAANKVLTLVRFTQPEGVTDYVNSLWKIQDHPFAGDALNSYNDGVPSPGAKPLGPFYELESSSPAAALAPGKTLTHTHQTLHLSGSEAALDSVAKAALGVSLQEIVQALPKP